MTFSNKYFVLLLTLFLPQPSYAFFCPNNFNQINIGDTIEQVTQQCGKPMKEEKKEIEPPTPQEWTYFIPQVVESGSMNMMPGTLKTTVDFDADGKAVNISVNGIGVGGSAICGSYIQLGSTRENVKAACGKPSNIAKSSNEENPELSVGKPKDKQTELTYQGNTPVTLVFEHGVLIKVN